MPLELPVPEGKVQEATWAKSKVRRVSSGTLRLAGHQQRDLVVAVSGFVSHGSILRLPAPMSLEDRLVGVSRSTQQCVQRRRVHQQAAIEACPALNSMAGQGGISLNLPKVASFPPSAAQKAVLSRVVHVTRGRFWPAMSRSQMMHPFWQCSKQTPKTEMSRYL
eukprot:TRINITY_DN65043_c0_g1_i1.p1 TRINITY_DN65043_c0_g1~~TRINITY_DN65043_c0_g1_i1.p1  ORF type:complete len:164 (-),score=20.90 TRINITY_DN65043_c0_g1_i1:442-933(-)